MTRQLAMAILVLAALPIARAEHEVAVRWNRMNDPLVLGYRVHVGPAPRAYVKSVDSADTRCVVLFSRFPLYLAVSAYTFEGLESDLSREIKVLAPGQYRPSNRAVAGSVLVRSVRIAP